MSALFEDREGNLWVANDQGLERFRDSQFITFSETEGFSSERNGPIFVDESSRTWFAPLAGGLNFSEQNRVTKITADGLGQDVIYSIAGHSKDDLWIGRQRGGLTHLHFNGQTLTAKTYTRQDGLVQDSVYTVYAARNGAVWAGTLSGGVSRFKDGQFTTYTTADGLAANSVTAITENSDGTTLWLATPNGLNALSNGSWRTFSIRDNLPSEQINTLLWDSSGVLWIGTAKGLAFLDRGENIHFSPALPAALQEPILGIAEDKNRLLWITTPGRILCVSRTELLEGAVTEGSVREYGLADGLKSSEGVKRSQSVVTDAAGRIWFSLKRGISMVDPGRRPDNSVPALVQIQSVSVDGAPVELTDELLPLRIPSTRQRLTFDYAGLSLSVPERVKFRYKLEGFDSDWSPPTEFREAVYTNLNPGSYVFHVIASNSDGMWNSQEAVVKFEIEPIFWQTRWFWGLIALSVGLGIVVFYRLRLRRVTRRLNDRFEERLAERNQIAQELHDSLLQGLVSVSMQLNVAVDNLPAKSASKPQLNKIIKLMEQVVKEGRNTLKGLRSSESSNFGSLEQALTNIGQDFTSQEQTGFRVIVEGSSQQIRPIIYDETYRIGREAVVNAFRHAKSSIIKVVVEYNPKHLRINISDDGCGINQKFLRTGREGHWGLSGMHERAAKIGADLKIRSRPETRTEVELLVPSYIAFENQAQNQSEKWLANFISRRAKVKFRKKEH